MKTLGQIAMEAAVPSVDWNNVHKENQDYYERIAKAVAEAAIRRARVTIARQALRRYAARGTKHAGDCDFYSSMLNRRIADGICTCGYGKQYLSQHDGDHSQMYSKELLESLGGKMER